MKEFHSEEYIDFLLRITPDNMHEMADRMKQHNVGFVGQYDCPVFDGIFPFCQIFTGGSLDGTHRLIDGSADIAINWSGGYVPKPQTQHPEPRLIDGSVHIAINWRVWVGCGWEGDWVGRWVGG